VPFTTVSAIEPGQTVQASEGIGRSVILELDGTGAVESLGPATRYGGSLRAGFDDAIDLVAVRTLPFAVNLDSRLPGVDRASAAADPRFLSFRVPAAAPGPAAHMADPAVAGLEHLLFGAWLQPDVQGFDFGYVAAGAYGTLTRSDGVPAAGSARYEGATIGHVVEADGTLREVSANLSLDADFTARTLGFTTDAAREISRGAAFPGLALAGTLVIGADRFTGAATTADGWTGAVDGRFFGPAAEEAGGAFDLAGASRLERYVGSFGAKR
jgi:hypothetical protein